MKKADSMIKMDLSSNLLCPRCGLVGHSPKEYKKCVKRLELCVCRKFGGYTEGYICRICKKPIYTKIQIKEISQEQNKKADFFRYDDNRIIKLKQTLIRIVEDISIYGHFLSKKESQELIEQIYEI